MIRWEYAVLSYSHTREGWRWSDTRFSLKTLDVVLSDMGREGWELVAITPQRLSNASFGAAIDEFEYIFKRPEC